MSPKTRLYLCGVIILLSAGYASLVAVNPRIATALAVGYIALVLTAMLGLNVWRRP